jgi:hypothetical protein
VGICVLSIDASYLNDVELLFDSEIRISYAQAIPITTLIVANNVNYLVSSFTPERFHRRIILN